MVSNEKIKMAKQVKNARKYADLTQFQLGNAIGKTKQWVSEVERGNIALSYEMAKKIADACNQKLDFFCQ